MDLLFFQVGARVHLEVIQVHLEEIQTWTKKKLIMEMEEINHFLLRFIWRKLFVGEEVIFEHGRT